MSPTKETSRNRPLALVYLRVSTMEQVDNGSSLEGQLRGLISEAEKRGWDYDVVEDAGQSAKSLNRPALQAALGRLDRGEADYLMSVRLDRVSRSVSDFAGLMDRAARKGWGIVLLSPNIDTTNPAGRFTANVLASAAQYERELIGLRTKEGMAQRRLEGVKLGRPSGVGKDVLAFIVSARGKGMSLRLIADQLNEAGAVTAQGGKKWHASTIKAVLDSEALASAIK